MAIILKSEKYQDIRINSHMIIGVIGYDYQSFLKSLTGDNVYYFNSAKLNRKKVSNIINEYKIRKELLNQCLNDLEINQSFLNKNIGELSHSEHRLLQYIIMFASQNNILVIDEPFQDLDYHNKKRIISILNRLAKEKTIIIGSLSTNIIYSICKKVLLLGKNKFLYEDTEILSNKSILRQYHLAMPEILAFVRLARDKKIHLSYSKDIRDLIKDVYKHVSK